MLTNIDRLNSAASLEAAREQARTVLREACRSSGHVELAGIVALNTRQAVEERCREGSALSETLSKVSRSVSGCGELEQLLALLREIMDRDAGKEAYRRKIAEAYSRIADSARERLRQHVQEYRESLPNPELLGMLDAHAKQLSASALSSLEQARQVVNAAAKDLDAWDESTEKALNKFHETLVLRLMDAVNRKVADLGHQFARDSVWREFDATEARAIARRAVDEFLDEQRGILHTWEDKLRLFSARMDEFSQECLARLSSNIDGLQDDPGEVDGGSSTATHFLVQTHRHMKNLAVFTTGLTVGRLTALGPISILVTAGNIIALAAASPSRRPSSRPWPGLRDCSTTSAARTSARPPSSTNAAAKPKNTPSGYATHSGRNSPWSGKIWARRMNSRSSAASPPLWKACSTSPCICACSLT